MSFASVTAMNVAFLDGLRVLFQQKSSKLRSSITMQAVKGERQAFDLLGSNKLLHKTSRNVAVPVTETARFRRWMEQKDYWNSERFDGFDLLREHTDPTGSLAKSWASGANREWDRCAIDAAIGTNYVDKNGSTAVSLPASQIVAHNNEGLTMAKVQAAVKKLRRVSPDRDDAITLFITSQQEDDLLGSPTITSADYYAGRPLMDGELPYFAGAHFHVIDDYLDLASPVSGAATDGSTGTFDPILPYDDSTGTPIRQVVAVLKSGLMMGELMPITTEVNPAKEYGINSLQLQVEMSVGGARVHESKVAVIECVDNSPMTFA